jgi:8-oxo-dGTP pyrophosphatase MutT (NUDIX family)
LIEEAGWRDRLKVILSKRERQKVTREGFSPSAVFIPLYFNENGLFVVLTRRSENLQYHKGQIAFPGGAYDEIDKGDLKLTALREAYEEIGLRSGDVEILGCLDDRATMSSSFIITPFVGAMPFPYQFHINHYEVDALIQAPVRELKDPRNFHKETPDSSGKLHPWGYFQYEEHRITGITALILKQFLDLGFD